MKCIALFLVLAMVVLMAEPGEGFWGHFGKGARAVADGFLGKAKDQQEQMEQMEQQEQQEQLAKRSFDADPQDDAPQDGNPSFN